MRGCRLGWDMKIDFGATFDDIDDNPGCVLYHPVC